MFKKKNFRKPVIVTLMLALFCLMPIETYAGRWFGIHKEVAELNILGNCTKVGRASFRLFGIRIGGYWDISEECDNDNQVIL